MTRASEGKIKRHQHYWLETGIPHDLVFLNRLFLWECAVCGKEKYFKIFRRPLNPIVPTAWEVYEREVANGNSHLVMQPPLIAGRELPFVEGERYSKLVKERSKGASQEGISQ